MKHGSTTTHLKQKDRQLSGQQMAKAVQSDKTLNMGAGKVMASVFWNARILFIDYLDEGKTFNSGYYMAVRDRLSA